MHYLPGQAQYVAGARTTLADYQAQHLGFAVAQGVATLCLRVGERSNPMSFEVYAELRDLFRELRYADDVKAVVLTGEGDNFCAVGTDQEMIGKLTKLDVPSLLEFARMAGDVVLAMRACPQPIVAAIDGICAGAGAMLALAADIRFATARSKISFMLVRLGLSGCSMGVCSLLPRIIGQGRASELLLTGRSVSGTQAESWGLYNRLCIPEGIVSDAQVFAAELAHGPSFAHGMTKRMLQQEWNMSLPESLEAEAQAQAICMSTNDFHRAWHAWEARQSPVFEGD
jgi:enoyl-CoA hydratase/carnithine racemase